MDGKKVVFYLEYPVYSKEKKCGHCKDQLTLKSRSSRVCLISLLLLENETTKLASRSCCTRLYVRPSSGCAP